MNKDGSIRLWDIETGQETHRFLGHRWQVPGLTFTADGEYVLSAGGEGTARLWRLPPRLRALSRGATP